MNYGKCRLWKNQIFYVYLFWKLQWSSSNIPKQISGDNINNIGTNVYNNIGIMYATL